MITGRAGGLPEVTAGGRTTGDGHRMSSAVRRVVTGTVDGKSTVVQDGTLQPITPAAMPGFEFYKVWGSDTTPELPTEGQLPSAETVFPPCGGSRFWLIRFPPANASAGEEVVEGGADLLADLAAMLPGLGDLMEPEHPGMHTTATVDYAIVIDGELEIELDLGLQVRLERGTTLVQNGTRHAWRTISGQPCLVAFAMVGAKQR